MLSQHWQLLPVHPRACGEHGIIGTKGKSYDGSSPRLRGTRDRDVIAPATLARTDSRFIPAPAGNTRHWPLYGRSVGSSPRLRGTRHGSQPGALERTGSSPRLRGTLRSSQSFAMPGGSSPRLRGTHFGKALHARACRFIPAPAGNTSGRMSAGFSAGSSPRLRGTLFRVSL